MARAMLNENNISQVFWADVMSMTCYISNRAYLHKKLNKTPYELHKGRKPNLGHCIFSDVSVSSTTMVRITWESLIPRQMKVYFWVIQIGVKLIESLILVLVLLKSLCMLFFVNPNCWDPYNAAD